MSLDILNMLIESACSDGEPLEDDKVLLRKKATELGISEAELSKMISAKVRGENYTPIIKDETPVVEKQSPPSIIVKEEKINITPPPVEKKEEILRTPPKKEEEIIIPGILKEEVPPKKIHEEKPEIIQPVTTKVEVKPKPPIETKKEETKSKPVNTKKEPVKVEAKKAPINEAKTEPKPAGKSKMPIIIVAVLVVLIVIGGFVFKDKIFGSQDKTPEIVTDNTDNTTDQTSNEDKYAEFMKKGNDAFGKSNFLNAKNNYAEALKYKAGDTKAGEMKTKMEQIISLQNEANDLFNKKNIARAKIRFDSLLSITPDISDAIDKKNKCQEIMDKAKDLTFEQEASSKKYGFSDPDGYIVIDYIFSDAKNFKRGVAPVKNGAGKWGFITLGFIKDAKYAIEHKFDKVWTDRGKYQASIEGESGYIYDFSYANGKLNEFKY